MNRIKALRRSAGLTCAELGKKLGIPQSTLCNYENGKRKLPIKWAIQIAQHFCVSVEFLTGVKEEGELGLDSVGGRAQYARVLAGSTQSEVAGFLGITPQAVSSYERGINAVPCAVKTGRWLLTDAYPHRMYCSKCFCTAVPNVEFLKQWGMEYEFCPHCGAPMKGGKG